MSNYIPKELIPTNDAERLQDLRAYNLLYTESEERFDNLTQIMAQVFSVPMVFMSLVDEDTVFYKSQVGDFGCDQTSRRDSLCSLSILKPELTVFEDTWQEASLATNPLTKGEGCIRFYAGAPLTTAKGNRIGSICVVDTAPRNFTEQQKPLLERFAKVIMHEMEVHLAASELVQARQKLEMAEESLRGAIDLANLATWSIDPLTGVLTYGDRMKEWLGIDENDHTFVRGPIHVPEEDRERIGLALERALQPESDGIYDEEHLIQNVCTGQRRIIHSQAKAYFTAKGEPYKLLGTAQDVTAQRQLQLALEQQVLLRTKELETSNKELGELNGLLTRSNENLQRFAYIASHDLQEPLRKIQQFGDLLASRYADQLGDGTDYLERMQSAARRMSVLIRDLLSFSRIATQRDRSQAISLTQVVTEVISDLDVQIQETGATILVEPLPIVPGDASQLGMLFQNLISNALKFCQPGAVPLVRVSSKIIVATDLPVSVIPTTAAQTYSCIMVSDEGIGFDEKYLDRIFQVFQRLHGKKDFAGTGVGLAICEKVVANHGGAITASSQPGQGATFSVYLPV